MSSSFALLIAIVVLASVCCSFGDAYLLSQNKKTEFYVLGAEAIYVIEPENKAILSKIGAEGVCTQSTRSPRKKCSFGDGILVRNDLIFLSDGPGKRVHIIDARKRKVVETVATDESPRYLYYLPWMEEVWVHSWTLSDFDVINVEGNLEKTHEAIKAHVEPGWSIGFMLADPEITDGKSGYVSHLYNPGIHRLDLDTKSYKGFLNVSDTGCSGTLYFAYSSLNKHAFVQCYVYRTPVALLEMDLTKEQVVRKWNFTGRPYASPDGRFIVTLFAPVNETVDVLLDSKVHVLFISKEGSPPILKSTLHIPSGVSELVYVKKTDQQGGYLAFISLLYSDKMAVLDLDQLESGSNAVSYIHGVGNVITDEHAVSRSMVMSGRWLLSPANANNTVAIIDTSTRKLHGMVMDVVGGEGVVAVPPSPPPSPPAAAERIWRSKETAIIVLLSSLLKLML
ncbi:follistatin-related protein 4-like [Montipora capricornis]|uniref:follistatin-related protein 4-like n=1 Tax=Montipora capricornis TaxID=246305 RepID=UPI0035F1EEFA